MFCRNCGEKLEKGVLYCPKCGTKNESTALETIPAASSNDNQNYQANNGNQNYQNYQANNGNQNYQNYQANNMYHDYKTNKDIPMEYKPIGAWGYFGWNLLFALPIAGFIVLLVFAFGGTQNINLRNYARSYFCSLLIVLLILLVLLIIFAIGAASFVGGMYY